MYSDVKNPRWSNKDKTAIDCEVNFDHVTFEEYTLFTAMPNDTFVPYAKEIFEKCANGEFGEIQEFVEQEFVEQE